MTINRRHSFIGAGLLTLPTLRSLVSAQSNPHPINVSFVSAQNYPHPIHVQYARGPVLGALPLMKVKNGVFVDSTGGILERLRPAGGDFDATMASPTIRALEERGKAYAMGLYMSGRLINGENARNPCEFDGLRCRISGSLQMDYGGAQSLRLSDLNSMIKLVPGATHLIMNKQMRDMFSEASRNTNNGFMVWGPQEFGERTPSYMYSVNGVTKEIQILATGYDSRGEQIISFDEAGDTTSIYVVRMGKTGIVGLCDNELPQISDLGFIQDEDLWRTRVEWLLGLAMMQDDAAARIKGINRATVIVDV